MKSLLIAGIALAAGMAFAGKGNGVVYSDDFNGTADGVAAWVGATKANGVQTIEESATCTPTAVDGLTCRVAELKVFVAEAGDEPSAVENSETMQFAIATGPETSDKKVSLWVYANEAWEDTGVAVASNSWSTIRMVFTYTGDAKTCALSINGTAVKKTYSNLNADASSVGSLEFVGATKVDTIVLADLEKSFESTSPAAGLTIAYDDLKKWGVPDATAVTEAQAEKLVAGLAPNGSVDFKATSLAKEGTKTVVSVPCIADNGQVYKVKITKADGSVSTVDATAGTIVDGQRSLAFDLPTDSKVLKFQILATTK